MDCKNVIDLLVKYIKGEVAGEEKIQIEDHLRRCQGCVKELARLKSGVEPVKVENVPMLDNTFPQGDQQLPLQKVDDKKPEEQDVKPQPQKIDIKKPEEQVLKPKPGLKLDRRWNPLYLILPACVAAVLVILLLRSPANNKKAAENTIVPLKIQQDTQAAISQVVVRTKTVVASRPKIKSSPTRILAGIRKEADVLGKALDQKDMEKDYDVLIDELSNSQKEKLMIRINEEIKKSL